jgi:hypothetical protein
VEAPAEIARSWERDNRAQGIRKERMIVTRVPFATRKSYRTSASAIGDRIFFLNSFQRLLRDKGHTDARRQKSQRLPEIVTRVSSNPLS